MKETLVDKACVPFSIHVIWNSFRSQLRSASSACLLRDRQNDSDLSSSQRASETVTCPCQIFLRAKCFRQEAEPRGETRKRKDIRYSFMDKTCRRELTEYRQQYPPPTLASLYVMYAHRPVRTESRHQRGLSPAVRDPRKHRLNGENGRTGWQMQPSSKHA